VGGRNTNATPAQSPGRYGQLNKTTTDEKAIILDFYTLYSFVITPPVSTKPNLKVYVKPYGTKTKQAVNITFTACY